MLKMEKMNGSVTCYVAEVDEGLFITKQDNGCGEASFGTTKSIWEAYWCGEPDRLEDIAFDELSDVLAVDYPKIHEAKFSYETKPFSSYFRTV